MVWERWEYLQIAEIALSEIFRGARGSVTEALRRKTLSIRPDFFRDFFLTSIVNCEISAKFRGNLPWILLNKSPSRLVCLRPSKHHLLLFQIQEV